MVIVGDGMSGCVEVGGVGSATGRIDSAIEGKIELDAIQFEVDALKFALKFGADKALL